LDKVWTYQFEQIAPGAAPRLGCECHLFKAFAKWSLAPVIDEQPVMDPRYLTFSDPLNSAQTTPLATRRFRRAWLTTGTWSDIPLNPKQNVPAAFLSGRVFDCARSTASSTCALPRYRSLVLCASRSADAYSRLSFAYTLDPSGQTLPNATAWPTYGSNANMLRLLGGPGNTTVFKDDYRPEMAFFTDQPQSFNMRRSLSEPMEVL
jgi:hypothetical protein